MFPTAHYGGGIAHRDCNCTDTEGMIIMVSVTHNAQTKTSVFTGTESDAAHIASQMLFDGDWEDVNYFFADISTGVI